MSEREHLQSQGPVTFQAARACTSLTYVPLLARAAMGSRNAIDLYDPALARRQEMLAEPHKYQSSGPSRGPQPIPLSEDTQRKSGLLTPSWWAWTARETPYNIFSGAMERASAAAPASEEAENEEAVLIYAAIGS